MRGGVVYNSSKEGTPNTSRLYSHMIKVSVQVHSAPLELAYGDFCPLTVFDPAFELYVVKTKLSPL